MRTTFIGGQQVAPAMHAFLDGNASICLGECLGDNLLQINIFVTADLQFRQALSIAAPHVGEDELDAVPLRVVCDVEDGGDVELLIVVTDGAGLVRGDIVPEDRNLFTIRCLNANSCDKSADIILLLELFTNIE